MVLCANDNVARLELALAHDQADEVSEIDRDHGLSWPSFYYEVWRTWVLIVDSLQGAIWCKTALTCWWFSSSTACYFENHFWSIRYGSFRCAQQKASLNGALDALANSGQWVWVPGQGRILRNLGMILVRCRYRKMWMIFEEQFCKVWVTFGDV